MNQALSTNSTACNTNQQHDDTLAMITESINQTKENDDRSDFDGASDVSSLPWWGMSIKPDINYNWESDPFNPVNFSKPFVPPVEITFVTKVPIIDEPEQNLDIVSPQRKTLLSMMKVITQQLPSYTKFPPIDDTGSSEDTTAVFSMDEKTFSLPSFKGSEEVHYPPYCFEYDQHQNQMEEGCAMKSSRENDQSDDSIYNDMLAGKHRKGMVRREFGRRIKLSLGINAHNNHRRTKSNTINSLSNLNIQQNENGNVDNKENDDANYNDTLLKNKKRILSFIMV